MRVKAQPMVYGKQSSSLGTSPKVGGLKEQGGKGALFGGKEACHWAWGFFSSLLLFFVRFFLEFFFFFCMTEMPFAYSTRTHTHSHTHHPKHTPPILPDKGLLASYYEYF